ncbi:MAG: type IV toxin-antitoxin system AbiEi family antitoxin domain-containing protein [Lapillicoccus sp.]
MPAAAPREPDHRTLGAPVPPRGLEALAWVAVEQRGLVTRVQCLGAGMSGKAVRWRVERGVWVRVHPGVYQTRPGRDDWHTGALAAQLAVPGSAFSHRTAGHLHGLVRDAPRGVDLLVDQSRRVAAPSGVTVRRRVGADQDVDPLHWPWRTTATATVLDIAELGTPDDVLALLGTAFHRGLTTEAALRAALAERGRHRRRALMADVLADMAGGAESVMEVRFIRDVARAHGLPGGRAQAATVVQGIRFHDVAYDAERVLLELDGRLGHAGAARVGDGVRDRRSATRGWLTVRAFWTDVAVTPCALAVEMSEVLATRGWRGRIHPCRRSGCVVRREA